jgi:hypothetical protein
VTCSDGGGMKGITVSAGAKSAKTDDNGNYTISDLTPGTYTVTPSGGDYIFDPPQRTVTLPPDATGVDFKATNGPKITNSPTGGIVCVAYSFRMAASGGIPPYRWSAAGLPPGLSINPATGEISGKPMQDGGFNVTITVTDAAGCGDSQTFKMNVKPNKPSIAVGALPPGRMCRDYAAQLQAAGGCPPYSWAISDGALPAGLSMDANGTITGIPTEAGLFTFTVTLADGLYQKVSQTVTLYIEPSPPPVVATVVLPPTSTCSTAYYLFQLQVSGGEPPYTWSLVGGKLPDGLFLSPDGTISGHPTKSGSFTFTVQVTDHCDRAAYQTLTIQVVSCGLCPPEIVTPSNLPDTKTHDQYSVQLQTKDPGSYTWSLVPGGGLASEPQPTFALPKGLSLSGGGVISGTVSECGWFQFAVRVTDDLGGSDTQGFEMKVTCDIPFITTTALPGAGLNEPYTAEIEADGGLEPYEWQVTQLPNLSYSSSGKKLTINWYPEELPVDTDTDLYDMDNPVYNDNGRVRINVTVYGADADTIRSEGSIPSDQKEFVIQVATGRVSTSTPDEVQCKLNTSCSVSLVGGFVTLLSAELPPGMTFTGTSLEGQPAVAGLWEVAFQVSDSDGNYQDGAVQIVVVPDPGLQVSTAMLPNGHVGDSYSLALPTSADGGTAPYVWSLVDLPGFGLPSGLSLDPSGTISGTPAQAGKFDVLVQVQDATAVDWDTPQTATRKYVLTIKVKCPN